VILDMGRLNTSGTRLQATVSVCATAAAQVRSTDRHAKSKLKTA
jgi:hypothetical protein